VLSFLSPLFLVGAAAIAIPIAIHLFYRNTEPVINFSAMRYLKRAPVEQSHRRRLREMLLLALRVTALLLLALAFARPFLSESAAALSAPATMVMIDTSASLSAPAAFERVRARAAEIIKTAPPTHAVGAMTFAHGADVIAPLSSDRAGALAAIAQLAPGAGATRYRAALRRAAEQFGDRPGRIVVITDLQQSGWDAEDGGVPERLAVDIDDAGGVDANMAMTSLRVEGTEAIATAQNFSPRAAIDQVVFSLGDKRIGAVPVSLAAGGSAEARMTLPAQASGALSASIVDRVGYAADNVRYAVVSATDAPAILAVTTSGHPSEALYLERAVMIAEGTGGFRFRSMSARDFSADAGATNALPLDDASVIALLGTRGLEQRGRERLAAFVRDGGGLLITAGPDVDSAVVKEALTGLVRTSWRPSTSLAARALTFAPDDSRHPIFRLFGGVGTLGNVTFARAALVDAPEGTEVLARYSDGSPAFVEDRSARGRVLVFASDLNNTWNDFPLQPAFVPFVHETLRYLASTRAARAEYVVGDLAGPRGMVPGIVTLTAGRHVAVNVDPREFDPARMTADEFRAGVARLNATAAQQAGADAREDEDSQRLWQYALLLMIASLAAEGIIGRRLG
jgi:hypothetical protein